LVKKFGISNYDDPFPGQGIRLIEEFKNGNIVGSLRHNKACLLKEITLEGGRTKLTN